MAGQLRRPCPRAHALADCLGDDKREDGRLFTLGAMARKQDRYARVATINGRTITVPKDGGYTAAEVVQYLEQVSERAPGCRWDFSHLDVPALNRAAEAKGITH